MKNGDTGRDLIVCCDGTNNTLTGRIRDTNVLLLVAALRRENDPDRVLYYDPGVGAPDELPMTGLRQSLRRKWDRVAGLASGQGIFENIGEAYSFLIRNYRDGDRIWIFGFSRGAFAARSVAGMVSLFGILKAEHRVMLPTLLQVYFASNDPKKQGAASAAESKAGQGKRNRNRIAEQVRELFTSDAGGRAAVYFVGVWDTVESVGMPGISLQISGSPTIAGKRIQHARHALSLDEHRWPFLPRLYEEADFGAGKDAAAVTTVEPPRRLDQSLRQAWFRGVHSDVGGGYPIATSGLSLTALHWMVAEANDCGLACPVESLPRTDRDAVVHDPLYDMPLWALAGMTVRPTLVVVDGTPLPPTTPFTAPSPVRSVWDERRPAGTLLLCLAGALIAFLLSGYMLMPGSGAKALANFASTPDQWLAATRHARDLAIAQLMPWSAPPFEVAGAGACPRRALLFDLLFVVGYSYVLARLCTRAFHRRAGLRVPGQPEPKLRILGAALPLLVFGDVLENLFGIAGFSFAHGTLAGSTCFGLGVLPALGKLVGLIGCLWLILIGWLFPRRH